MKVIIILFATLLVSCSNNKQFHTVDLPEEFELRDSTDKFIGHVHNDTLFIEFNN